MRQWLGAAFALGLAACGAAGGTTSASGIDASTGDDVSSGSDDATDLDVMVPSTCPVLQQWHQLCNPADACGAYLVAHCGAYDQDFSAGAREAIATCYAFASSSCAGDAGDAAASISDAQTCLQQEILAAAPTLVQQKLATDYCARCSPADASCASDFYTSLDGGPGAGAAFLEMSDALVAEIDAACAAGSSDAAMAACAAGFDACASGVYTPVLPSLACPLADAGGP